MSDEIYYVVSSDLGCLRANEENGKWTFHPYSDEGNRRFSDLSSAIRAVAELPRWQQGGCRVFRSDNFYDEAYKVPNGETVADNLRFDGDVLNRRAEEVVRHLFDLAEEVEYHAIVGDGVDREVRVRRARKALWDRVCVVYAKR